MRHLLNTNTLVCSCGRTRENHINLEITNERVRERWFKGDVDFDRDYADIDKALEITTPDSTEETTNPNKD